MDLLGTRQVDPFHQSPQARMYGFFAHGTVPPSRLYWSGFLSLPDHLRRLPSPSHFRRRLPGHVAFPPLRVPFSPPTSGRASPALSLALIGSLTPVLPGDSASSPEVTRCSSVPCRPQSPSSGG